MMFYFLAEYGDYDSNEHKDDFIQEYQLLPMVNNRSLMIETFSLVCK